jgi:DUF1009 family protein
MPGSTNDQTPDTRLGIIAGDGDLPLRIITSCKQQGRDFFVLYLKNGAELPKYLKSVPHATLKMGEVGKALKTLQKENINQITFAGRVPRVSLKTFKVDLTGAKLLASITGKLAQGDNVLLSTIIRFFEGKGFTVVGAHEIATNLLAPKGIIGKVKPGKTSLNDIARGKAVAHTMGELDIGQSIVVLDGNVLGVEAAEGTDNLIKRCKTLQPNGAGAVLVKMKKPGQDARIDLPTIGVTTVKNIIKSGFGGIAVEAGTTLIIDRDKVVAEADKHKVFVVGV